MSANNILSTFMENALELIVCFVYPTPRECAYKEFGKERGWGLGKGRGKLFQKLSSPLPQPPEANRQTKRNRLGLLRPGRLIIWLNEGCTV
jgi:hypothetical protein